MARTYAQLKSEVLTLCDFSTAALDAGAVVEKALENVMRYVARKVELPGLIASASFTAISATDPIPLFTALGFNITQANYDSPNRLYIRNTSTATQPGQPYDYLEFMHWLELKSVPSGAPREDSLSWGSLDERPTRAYTIDLTNGMNAYPIAIGNVLTFYYNKPVTAYADAGFPELPAPSFDTLLVNGAMMVLQAWTKEPDSLVDYYSVFRALDPEIGDLDSFLNSRRKRSSFKIHNSYRIR